MKKFNFCIKTKQVFNECAKIYLKEDKHWGCDLDIICEYVEKFKDAEVIELGTGHAWHIANLFFLAATNLKRIVGIDYSQKMIERAKLLLNSIIYNGNYLIDMIEIRKGNILSLPYKKESFDVAILLNNTIGNIPGETFAKARDKRKKALREIRRVIRNTGFIILSVYNSKKLTEEDKYGRVFELDHKLSNIESFDLVIRYKQTGTPYYSHWFNQEEIRKLLYDVSFRIVEVEERRKRIIVVAKKK